MIKLFSYFLILNVFITNAQTQTGESRKDSICVTMKELLLNPKKYDKKYIAVTGFVFLEKKARSAIYISENDYKNEILDNSIWLSFMFESSTYQISSTYNKTYATIVGWFNKGSFSAYDEFIEKELETKNGMISSIVIYDK